MLFDDSSPCRSLSLYIVLYILTDADQSGCWLTLQLNFLRARQGVYMFIDFPSAVCPLLYTLKHIIRSNLFLTSPCVP